MRTSNPTSAIPAPLRKTLTIFTILITTNLAATSYATEFMAGADISSLKVHENSGATYRDYGQTQPADAIEILSNHGVNWYRLRLFVNPQFQNNFNGGSDPFVAQDLAYTIALAERVKQAGG
jgi:arabinogalactan endo-1,4-beta-galactosidase